MKFMFFRYETRSGEPQGWNGSDECVPKGEKRTGNPPRMKILFKMLTFLTLPTLMSIAT